MKIHEATEQAYKNGYDKGYADGRPKWIPVTERLPDIELVDAKTEERDLFACLVNKIAFRGTRKSYITKAWYDGKGFIDTDCIDITNEITHWMPLP